VKARFRSPGEPQNNDDRLGDMAITVDQIDEWRQLPSETEHIEFKEAKTQYDMNKLFGYCVAIANEGGGHLVLGIQNARPRIVVGTKAINDRNGMAEKILSSLGFRVDIEEIDHPDGRVVVLRIPGRPRGSAYDLEGAYLMRCGASLVPMTQDQLRRIFSEGGPEWSDEPSKSGLGPARILELLDTVSFFKLIETPHPATVRGVIDRLLHERLIDENEMTGSFTIRRLGALLLANDLGDFPDLARKAPRVVEYGGPSKLDSPRADITGKKGYAAGFQGLVHFITTHLPKKEVILDALRKEVRLLPDIAIREVVANALIHQDLTITGSSVMVEIYSNRLEISNPGEPIISADRFIDGYRSRNERLADLMRRMCICEERGSGIDKVVNAAEEYDLPAPDFRVGEKRTIITIFGPQDFDQMDRETRIRACYQHCVLKYVRSEHMTNQSLRERLRLPESRIATVSQVIGAAVEAGVVRADEKVGSSRKFARYLPFWA
jgi:ATP-dependent DNA helicase RecG